MLGRFLTLSLCIFLLACGKQPTTEPVLDVTGFEPYVQTFEKYSRDFGHPVTVTNLRIQFGETQKQERAYCLLSADRPPTITINESKWSTLEDSEREELLFHEMGHCVLKRKHRSEVMDGGIPESLMNPYAINRFTYSAHQNYYLDELFAHSDDLHADDLASGS